MISKLRLVVDGKEVEVKLTAEQIHQICMAARSDEHLTGWEAPEQDQEFYYIDALCRVQAVTLNENSKEQQEILWRQANCFTSKKLADDMARSYALLRNLRRFAAINRKTPIDREGNGGYTITYNYVDKCLECGLTGNWMAIGDVLFDTEEIARDAMNEYAEELIWYFTEMKDSM